MKATDADVETERLLIEARDKNSVLVQLTTWKLTRPGAVVRAKRQGLVVTFAGVVGVECLDAVVTLGKEFPAIGLVVKMRDLICAEALCLDAAYQGLVRSAFTEESRAIPWIRDRARAVVLMRRQPVASLGWLEHTLAAEPQPSLNFPVGELDPLPRVSS